jgi:hypothetical protein
MRMRHIVVCGMSGSTIFSTPPHKGSEFRGEKFIGYKMRVLMFSTNLVENILLIGRNERDMIKNLYWSLCKVSVVTVRFNETGISSSDFRKTLSLMKIRPVVAEFVHADIWTDRQTHRQTDTQTT